MEEKHTLRKTSDSPEILRLRIEGLIGAFRSERVRWLMDREKETKQNSGMSDQTYKELLIGVVRQEAERSTIVSHLKNANGGTIGEIASSTRITQKQIIRHMVALMKKGSVFISGEKGDEYLFTAAEPPE